MKYRIKLHCPWVSYAKNPPQWEDSYERCINWVNMQPPAYDWMYTVLPVEKKELI